MTRLIGLLIACCMVLGTVAEAAPRASARAKVVAQYRALQYQESCAWRRVVQGPAYAIPTVGSFAFVLAWDCDISEAQAATRAREAYGRKHGFIRAEPAGRSSQGNTAWYPAGFR